MSDVVTCAMCNEEFETGWTDEEASVEFEENFPGHDIRNADLVCDDCYQKIMVNREGAA